MMTAQELRTELTATAELAVGWHRELSDYATRDVPETTRRFTRDAWLAERFRLAGMLWVAMGRQAGRHVTFPLATDLAARAAAGEITPDQMLTQAGLTSGPC